MIATSYLVFRISGALYGVPASAVRELFQLPELTPAPEAPLWVAGILNFRGKVIPVLDLGMRLGLGSRTYRLSDTIIVLEQDAAMAGIVVDDAVDVRAIADTDTERSPFAAGSLSRPLLAGRMARVGDGLITLLDVEDLLRHSDALALPDTSPEALPDDYSAAPVPFSPEAITLLRERSRSLIQSAGEVNAEQVAPVAVIDLNTEWFGVDLEWVREFADLRGVTAVPCCPEHIVGTVNLRGEILTLVDVRKALLMPAPTSLEGAKMMVVQLGELRAGVVVDQVLDVVHLGASDLAPVPYSVRSSLEEHVAGMAAYRDKMLAILDLPGIFNREDWIVDQEP